MSKAKIPKIIIAAIAGVILIPFIAGLYAIGPIEFPCTYQQVQGKKSLKNLENDIQNLEIAGKKPASISKSSSLDCLDGSLKNPIAVTTTFNLSSPVSLSEAETLVLANKQITEEGKLDYHPVTNLGSSQDDPRMREMRISDLEATYSGADDAEYMVSYNLQSSVACTPPTPPESNLDVSLCKDKTVVEKLGIEKQPIKTITISRTVIPAEK